MQHAATLRASAKPPIHLVDAEYDLIADLALSMERRSPELSKLLLDEIDRAEIHAPGTLPAEIVSIGSEVEYLDMGTGERRRVRLVMPAEADIEAGRLSILTPVGAGLIGLARGQSIDWPCPSGRPRVLRILEVLPPEAP
jgi:regulator of nucleoside diphosphate kinase